MKRLIFISLTIALISLLGCGEQKLTQEEIEDTKEEIRSLIMEQGKAYEAGNIKYFKNAVSNEIMEFGTTRNEVSTNPDEWLEGLKDDFQTFDSTTVKFSKEPRHLSIQVSETGDMAAAIYESPYKLIYKGESFPGLFRIANTWRKENGEWKIVQWLVARPVNENEL